MSRQGADVLVLGVGNILWADEGFGVRCVEQFARRYAEREDVAVLDGGTQGLGLVNDLADAKRILIFDAVDVGAPPADMIVVRGDEVPRFVAGKKVSLHQTSMMEVLALAELMASCPPEAITLIGCQPAELEDYGGGLTAQVAARVEEAVDAAAHELAEWGFTPAPLLSDADPSVAPEAVAWRAYEEARPSADAACRVGDARVLERLAARD